MHTQCVTDSGFPNYREIIVLCLCLNFFSFSFNLKFYHHRPGKRLSEVEKKNLNFNCLHTRLNFDFVNYYVNTSVGGYNFCAPT